MQPNRDIPCFRVLGASSPFGSTCMRVGWKATDDGFLLPRSRLFCDVLHLSGTIPASPAEFAAQVAELCSEVGARAVFWSPETAESKSAAEIAAFWQTHHALRVYSPFAIPGTIPVVSDLSGPLPTQAAAAILARAAITEIRNGKAEKRIATSGEIGALIETYRPEIAFSAELAANFFTLHPNDVTIFAVFDTEETLTTRVTRAVKNGAAAVFCDICEKI
ncbi:MAG: hypothetical protein IJC93_02790 [Clostridia bacterium]|nr:hypothetical protein [Clostridia bacterium]